MQIKAYMAVTLNYLVRDQDGEVVDSSDVDGPLAYVHGTENLLPGLEKALEGHQLGERLSVSVARDEAYGDYDEALVDQVPRENFPGIEEIRPGMQFQTEMEDGEVMVVTVTEVDDEFVTVDGNHPLAGKDLHFELEIIEVRDATSEEIEHGHVHPEGEESRIH